MHESLFRNMLEMPIGVNASGASIASFRPASPTRRSEYPTFRRKRAVPSAFSPATASNTGMKSFLPCSTRYFRDARFPTKSCGSHGALRHVAPTCICSMGEQGQRVFLVFDWRMNLKKKRLTSKQFWWQQCDDCGIRFNKNDRWRVWREGAWL